MCVQLRIEGVIIIIILYYLLRKAKFRLLPDIFEKKKKKRNFAISISFFWSDLNSVVMTKRLLLFYTYVYNFFGLVPISGSFEYICNCLLLFLLCWVQMNITFLISKTHNFNVGSSQHYRHIFR